MAQDRHAHVLVLESEGVTRFDLVRRSREVFERGCIKTLAPYADALRVFFRVHSLAQPDEDFMVADDLGDRILLTVFQGGRAAMTRMIPSLDPVMLVDEIRRTRKNVQEKGSDATEIRVLRTFSNHAGLKDTIFFETRFPVFDVLGKVKFPPLMSPEEAAETKKRVVRREFIRICLVGMLMGGVGTGVFVHAQHAAAAMDARLGRLSLVRSALDEEVQELGRLTYRSSISRLPSTNFAIAFDGFLNNVPLESDVISAVIERGAGLSWDFTGTILFPRQEICPFALSGGFAGAGVENIHLQGKPGLRISMRLPDRREAHR